MTIYGLMLHCIAFEFDAVLRLVFSPVTFPCTFAVFKHYSKEKNYAEINTCILRISCGGFCFLSCAEAGQYKTLISDETIAKKKSINTKKQPHTCT